MEVFTESGGNSTMYFVCSIVANFMLVTILNSYILTIIETSDDSDKDRDKKFFSSLRKIKNIWKIIVNIIINIFNLDYVASKCSKKLLKPKQEEREEQEEQDDTEHKMFILKKNKYNFIISCFSFIFTIILVGIFEARFQANCTNVNLILNPLCVFLFIRFVSRSLEIIIAFYKDISDDKNDSNLESNERFLLAVKSLAEIIVRSATIYLLIYTVNDESSGKLLGNTISSVYLSVLNSINFGSAYSAEIITGEICENRTQYELILRSVVVLQSVTSFVLIILSFAKYLSGEVKDKSKKPDKAHVEE